VEVFGKYTAARIEIGLHTNGRGGRNETQAAGGVKLGARTVKQDDVVLVEVGLAIPKAVRCIGEATARHLVAAVGTI
jgi:hypothetical protein